MKIQNAAVVTGLSLTVTRGDHVAAWESGGNGRGIVIAKSDATAPVATFFPALHNHTVNGDHALVVLHAGFHIVEAVVQNGIRTAAKVWKIVKVSNQDKQPNVEVELVNEYREGEWQRSFDRKFAPAVGAAFHIAATVNCQKSVYSLSKQSVQDLKDYGVDGFTDALLEELLQEDCELGLFFVHGKYKSYLMQGAGCFMHDFYVRGDVNSVSKANVRIKRLKAMAEAEAAGLPSGVCGRINSHHGIWVVTPKGEQRQPDNTSGDSVVWDQILLGEVVLKWSMEEQSHDFEVIHTPDADLTDAQEKAINKIEDQLHERWKRTESIGKGWNLTGRAAKSDDPDQVYSTGVDSAAPQGDMAAQLRSLFSK